MSIGLPNKRQLSWQRVSPLQNSQYQPNLCPKLIKNDFDPIPTTLAHYVQYCPNIGLIINIVLVRPPLLRQSAAVPPQYRHCGSAALSGGASDMAETLSRPHRHSQPPKPPYQIKSSDALEAAETLLLLLLLNQKTRSAHNDR